MKRIVAYAIVGVLVGPINGCVTTDSRELPFTDSWSQHMKTERALQMRKQRIKGSDEIVLWGESDKNRAAIYMDEKGRPRLNVGRKTGWSADMDYDGGPEAEVKYKLKWDFAKPDKKGRTSHATPGSSMKLGKGK